MLLHPSESQKPGEEAKEAWSSVLPGADPCCFPEHRSQSRGASDAVLQALLTLQLLNVAWERVAQHFSQGFWNVFSEPRGSHEVPGSRWTEEESWVQFPASVTESSHSP